MTTPLARFFSFVFHPVFIPLYSFLIILYLFPFHFQSIPKKEWNLTIGIMLAMTMLMPSIIVGILKKLNLVSDYDISEQKQRIFPYLIFFFFYLMAYLTIRPKANNSYVFFEDPLLASVLLGATLSLGVAFFLNNFLKVSVHAMGVANLLALVCLFSRNTQKSILFLLLISIIAIGVTGSARIYLKAHTPREVYYGILCGMLGQLFAFLIYFGQ